MATYQTTAVAVPGIAAGVSDDAAADGEAQETKAGGCNGEQLDGPVDTVNASQAVQR